MTAAKDRPRPGAVTAILPMKGNSQRVPGKNIRPLCGKPLFHWIVEALLATRAVGRVVIETDSDAIAADARQAFPQATLLRRPPELVGDTVSMNALLAWHLGQVEGEWFMQVHATTPLLTAETLDRAVSALAEAPDRDSLFGVTRLHTRLYWEDGRPINHDPQVLIQTQDLPPVFEENSNVYLFSRASFAPAGRRIGAHPMMFETPPLESVDIDWEPDFAYCDFLMARRLSQQEHPVS